MILTFLFIFRALEEYLRCECVVFDERRGIPIECMHPQKPDWQILGLSGAPPDGVKAWEVKEQQRREQEERIARGNADLGSSIAAPRASRSSSAKVATATDKPPADTVGSKRGRNVGKGKAASYKRKTPVEEVEAEEDDVEDEEDEDDDVEEVEPEVVVLASAKGVSRKVLKL